jgi:hypothetical protein
MRDPELVARAQRAATGLESAWKQWRALRGLAVAPGPPRFSQARFSRSSWPNLRIRARANTKVRRCLARP